MKNLVPSDGSKPVRPNTYLLYNKNMGGEEQQLKQQQQIQSLAKQKSWKKNEVQFSILPFAE